MDDERPGFCPQYIGVQDRAATARSKAIRRSGERRARRAPTAGSLIRGCEAWLRGDDHLEVDRCGGAAREGAVEISGSQSWWSAVFAPIRGSMTVSNAAADAREAVAARREQLGEVLRRYGASNPRLFGSVARGDATTDSDIDVLVDLDPAGGNPLMRVAGLSEEFRSVLGVDVDVVAAELLRDGVAETALADAVAL